MTDIKPNYLEGYRLAIENAKKHFEIAEIVVKNGISFGIANSHLVLASEETVKAGMLFSLYYDPEIKVDDFAEYFSNHKHKHNTIISVEFWLSLTGKMIESVSQPAKERYNRKGDYLTQEEVQQSLDEGADNLINFFENVLADKDEIKTNEGWWKQADTKKNQGFYVQLNKGNNKWETPSSTTETEYLKTKKIVQNLMKDFVRLEEIFAQKEMQEVHAKLKKKEKLRRAKK